MEQFRYREAAVGEGCEGHGWSRHPPYGGDGDSAAWNGNCARPAEEEDEDHELPFPSPDGPRRCSCGCRREPTAPPSLTPRHRDASCSLTCHNRTLPAEEGEEDGGGEGRGGRRQRRRQRHRSAPKERSDGAAGRRQRPARKRSRGEGPEWPGPAEGLAGYRQLLGTALCQALRLGAELGGRLLSCCRRFGAAEWGPALAAARSWARGGSVRAARWLRAGTGFVLRLLWMLLALLVLLLLLLLGCLRLLWRWGTAGALRLAGTGGWAPALLGRTWGELLGENGTGRKLWDWARRKSVGVSPGGTAVPGGGQEEVARLVAMAEVPEEELNPFEVLGVELAASDAELRRAYRRLAVLVHPDKSQHPRAEEAFKVLRAAWDRVSSPEKRREYESKQLAEQELRRSVGQFLSRLQEDLQDALNTMACSRCQGKHRRFEVQRDPGSGRYCGQCGVLHPAEEGDLWAESSLLGLKVTYLARMEGRIYDITEWAGCQRVGIAPDTHRVPYHISFAARGTVPAGRQRTPAQGCPPSAADLQDLFSRILQGSSGAVPGGPFPPPPAPSPGAFSPPGAPPGAFPSPGPPPRPEGAAPKGDAKHKRRKKLRRPLQR